MTHEETPSYSEGLQTFELATYDIPDPTSLASAAVRASSQDASSYRWRVHINKVSPEERDRRILESPMERILEQAGQYSSSDESINRILIERYQKHGDLTARERLVVENIKLVIHLAKISWKQALAIKADTSLDFEDLVQEGTIGLQHAVEKFDLQHPSKAKFSTYAARWIVQKMDRVIFNQGSTIRIPVNVAKRFQGIKREINQLQVDLQRSPSRVEIVEGLTPPMPPDLARATYDEAGFLLGDLTERRLAEIAMAYTAAKGYVEDELREEFIHIEALRNPLSLDRITRDSDGDDEVLIDPASVDGVDLDPSKINKYELWYELNDLLSDREKHVIVMRYGLLDQKPKTIDQISRILSVSLERVRQIETQALKKLRAVHAMQLFRRHDEDLGSMGDNTVRQTQALEAQRDTLYPVSTINRRHTPSRPWGYTTAYESTGTTILYTPRERTAQEGLLYLKTQHESLLHFDKTGDAKTLDRAFIQEMINTLEGMRDIERQFFDTNGYHAKRNIQLLKEIDVLYAILEGVDFTQLAPITSLTITSETLAKLCEQ